MKVYLSIRIRHDFPGEVHQIHHLHYIRKTTGGLMSKKRSKKRRDNIVKVIDKRTGARYELYPFTVFGPCIVCGSPSANSGTFIPDDQAAYGAIPGELRTFAYALCDECTAKGPQTLAKIEQKIEAHWRAAFTRKVLD